ncbi:hypothetical protein Ocin01_12100 [Orchesella cincta]|uniref:Uncharacterized protein n=1 Tax=Orchesella cincta TaxID=48709 RepID=A0A1D2MNC7_ORCCI|nr:hypothetical protein Ocin01_12100 [Orchesella cincta]
MFNAKKIRIMMMRKSDIQTMAVLTILVATLSILISVEAAPKEEKDAVRVAYSIKQSKSSSTSSSSSLSGTTARQKLLPVAESTLPHAPVLRDMNDSGDQHDMSTSTPSSESLESQLQSPHVIRKKALVDFDTSYSADDLLQNLEMVQ